MTLDEIRRRPTLPGRFQPSTISVLRLNFCVRDGNRWIPQAIVTGNMGLFGSCAPALPSLAFWLRFALLRVASLRASSDSLRSRFPFPRTLKTAQVRFRSAPSDQDFPSLLASTFPLRLPCPLLTGSSGFASLSNKSSSRSRFRSQLPGPLPLLLFPVHSPLFPSLQDQALDRLVSSSSIHCCTSTDDLSTLSSSRGLTCF